jgi:hypothetical protein
VNRWRLRSAGIEKRAEISPLTLAHPFCWRLTNASVGKRVKFGYLTLAHVWQTLGSASRTEFLILGQNIFNINNLAKKVRILLILYFRLKHFKCLII